MRLIIHTLAGITFSFLLHLIFHELGHLLGALLTGWKFLYLQIFNIAVVREERWNKLKKVDSRSFQCIMSPAGLYSNPYVYNLGGCLANLFLSVIGLTGVFILAKSIVLFLYGWSLSVMGAGFLIMNGIPRVKRICNDMACHLLLKKDSVTRLCHNLQLMTAGMLINGATYRQMPEEMLRLPADEAYNDILAYQAILEYYYFLDLDDYRGMAAALEKIKDINKLSDSIKSCYNAELLYVNLIKHIKQYQQLPAASNANGLYILSKELMAENPEGMDLACSLTKRHIKGNFYIKGDLHSERVRAVLEAYRELLAGSRTNARMRLARAIEDISGMACIYPGEREFCIRQIRKILFQLEFWNRQDKQ